MEERRERKKRQTREALIRAALELFDAKGYEHTAVREITDAVDVSERTFFRYFASKEDLAVSFAKDWTDAILAALVARPAAEEPLAARRLLATQRKLDRPVCLAVTPAPIAAVLYPGNPCSTMAARLA